MRQKIECDAPWIASRTQMATPRRCEAFTKSFRACRGYADHDTGLCALHADFYRDKWLPFLIRNYQPLTWGPTNTSSLEKARLIAGHRSIDTAMWPVERVEAAVAEHALRAQNPVRMQVLCLYEVLCLEKRVRPSKLRPLWLRTMLRYWEILSFMVSTGVHPERLEKHVREHYLMPFVQTMDDLLEFYTELPTLLAALPPVPAATAGATLIPILLRALHDRIGSDFSYSEMGTFVEAATAGWRKRAADLRPELQTRANALLGEHMQMLQFHWTELRAAERLRRRAACDRFKEELMMRTWHPDRVMRLLEAGIDVEDM